MVPRHNLYFHASPPPTSLLDDHSSCIAQLREWAGSHPSMNVIVDTYALPLTSLRTSTNFPKLSNDIDLVIVGHLAEVGYSDTLV